MSWDAKQDRVRSFMERYVIERAGSFRADHEDEDMWHAVLSARRAYRLIAHASQDAEVKLPAGNDANEAFAAQQSGVSLSPRAVAALNAAPTAVKAQLLQNEAVTPGFIERLLNKGLVAQLLRNGEPNGTQKTP